MGENGAGKSTLLRVIAGALRPTGGEIRIGEGVRLAWVPQEADLPANLTAADWIFLARELRTVIGWLRRRAMARASASVLRRLDCRVAPGERLGSLTGPQRKQVQLCRAFQDEPDVLLLDEPTAVLGEAETRRLFSALRERKERGAAALYVSHRLEEVLAIADRVTVLRDGRWISTDEVGAVDVPTLVRRMVGRDVGSRRRARRQLGEPLLRLTNAACAAVRGVSFTVRRGEIVGLAGLVGAGRSEILEVIAGLRPVASGTIERHAIPVLVPEDRITKGLVQALRLRENLFLPAEQWLLQRSDERKKTARWIEALGIRTAGVDAAISSLSGGNQQKTLIARGLRHHPELFLLDEPTAGIDVGAKAEIHQLIYELAEKGTGILMTSSDLPELLMLCDTIIALCGGKVVAQLDARDTSEPELAALITGADVKGLGCGA